MGGGSCTELEPTVGGASHGRVAVPSRRSTGNRDLVHRKPGLTDPLHTETTGTCTPHLASRWGDQEAHHKPGAHTEQEAH